VSAEESAELDAWLPDRRCTEVTLEYRDGSRTGLAQPNPIGDALHFPLTAQDVHDKLVGLVGADSTRHIGQAVQRLGDDAPVATVLRDLSNLEA
jgi:hypothetical protein